MTRLQIQRVFERDRARLSHDLFKNTFGGLLQPGFRDERNTDSDVVLRALNGDESCRHDAVEPALVAWNQCVLPALEQFVGGIASRYGFVTNEAWDAAISSVGRAAAKISAFACDAAAGDARSPEVRVADFWVACDDVRTFLDSLSKSFSTYFVRWDPSLIREDLHA